MAMAEDNTDQAWVCPANSDPTHTSFKGALCVSRTDDGGKSWKVLRNGLPQEHCFDIVYRHALACSGAYLAFGTTTENLFMSADRGDHWQVVSNYFLWHTRFNLPIRNLPKKGNLTTLFFKRG